MILPPTLKKIIIAFGFFAILLLISELHFVRATNALAIPPFSQDWTNTTQITTNDDWSNVPSIIGYLGNDDSTTVTGIDPQTLLAESASPAVDVIANQTNPNITNGGVAEFHLADPTVALQASGTADAPYIKIFLNTTDMNKINIKYKVRDIDGSTDNAVQPVALHYRIGSSGNFTNIPSAYIADATTGPALATLVTSVNVELPTVADNQPHVELRIITANASGSDEWVGIDDITITANSAPTGISLSPTAILENQPAGTTIGTFTATDPDGSDTHIFSLITSSTCNGSGVENSNFVIVGNILKSSVSFDFELKPSYDICVQVTDSNGLSTIVSQTVNVTDIADETPPSVLFSSNTVPANDSILLTAPTQITVEFNEDVKNDASIMAANNTANYLLVSAGMNGKFDTVNCEGGRVTDDMNISVNSVDYENNGGNGPFVATLEINNNISLVAGIYRLFICGTTSIEDLTGNELNGGTSDTQINFTISSALNSSGSLPVTGFPIGKRTQIPQQPLDKTYASFSDLWLEIPSLTLSTPIVGVPLTAQGWDVTWLGKEAGWLNGTAFPTWTGNSVITAHVWDAYNQPGPFYKLKALRYGDFINVHAFGKIYVYEVRQSKQIAPDNFAAALKHEDKTWLTLLTCEDYRLFFQTYTYRRMVRAVLVSVSDEK